jgi:transposase
VAASRSPNLVSVQPADHVAVLRLLAKRNLDLGRQRNRVVCRLHAMLCELVAGGMGRELSVSKAESALATVTAASAVDAAKVGMAFELVEDVRRLDGQLADIQRRIRDAVEASKTSLTDLFGVGPVVACLVIGYTGDVTRFANNDRYAAYNGTAPIELSSAGRVVHRLSRRGNRTLNYAIHMAAVSQIRHLNSEGRVYFDRKIDEGKTPREALRALKRRVSDAVYRQLVIDAQRRAA